MTSQTETRLPTLDGRTVVVLDTNAARNLGEEEIEPTHVATFESMARDGYLFSLADGAVAELLNQRLGGQISDTAYSRMLSRIERFLDTELPMFPGASDISAVIGGGAGAHPWSAENFHAVADASMAYLRAANDLADGGLGERDRQRAAAALQEARDGWIEHFGPMLLEFPPTDEDDELGGPTFEAFLRRADEESPLPYPPFSTRLDLGLKFAWRQHVRKNRSVEPYDPTNRKKLNDGIDFELYYFLMLPGLLVTSDKGFGVRLDPISSFQRDWIWKPEELAAAWSNGERPEPRWPSH